METKSNFKWVLKEMPISSLKPHGKNPRQIGKDQFDRLGKLIDKFGLIDKPIVNTDLTIIGGHQRVKFFKKKKQKTIECMVAEQQLSDKDIDELCIGLNLHQGSFDYDILANQWEVLDLLEYGFSEEKLLGISKESEDIFNDSEEESSSKKKQKVCPKCGHEF